MLKLPKKSKVHLYFGQKINKVVHRPAQFVLAGKTYDLLTYKIFYFKPEILAVAMKLKLFNPKLAIYFALILLLLIFLLRTEKNIFLKSTFTDKANNVLR